ncbi:MAG TPA: YbhB/YbcL family Raf kinase inhibitor-like protein [Pyrinomonadaceae bacterium]
MIKIEVKIFLIAIALFALSSCRNQNSPAPQNNAQPSPVASPTAATSSTPASKGAMKLTSSAFADGEMIPAKYTCDGENVSPPLKWEGVPEKARTVALFMEDADAPGGRFAHWVLYNLSASAKELPENIPPEKQPAGVARQGTNDFKQIGYGGPCPPSGTHRYFFKLYALDTELALDAGATREDLLNAMQGHIIGQGDLVGKYEKKK